ncbi:M4 family metallopeptidase [Luedemannella flava]|uniref:Neutral metalloproteinase n=1 Tax=Luedemannella flava TaxID=349316 RepID=A0ABN2MJM0_9ACTN
MNLRRVAIPTTLALVAAGVAAVATVAASPATAERAPVAPRVDPAAAADTHLARTVGAAAVHRGSGDTLQRRDVTVGGNGLRYVSYTRTYRGLPVIGGDAVVVTDADGAVKSTAAAQTQPIAVGTTVAVSAATAAATARKQLASVTTTSSPALSVLAWDTPALVWETIVEGTTAQGRPSRLHVFVDATTGVVRDTLDDVREGTGNGYYHGSVTINTSGSGSSYSMTDPTRGSLRCGGQNGAAYTGTDDSWGNGSGTNLEAACVDAMFAAQKESDMLSAWLGRNGINGSGGAPPIRVGLSQVNAYWNGSYVNFGRSQDGARQATSADVVGHELGHAIFQYTPGGAGSSRENGGLNEATGDIFGALTEAYINSPLDPPDYQVGERVNLVGGGPIRYMYQPSLAGDPNCYTSAIPNTEVHAAAGPLNHWFYLLAEGSSPGNGKPNSPTCNNSSVTGISLQKAGKIYYNAMLSKTSSWRYINVRVATLNAARNLYPNSCVEFNAVLAAWNAVTVPTQSGEPTCTGTGTTTAAPTSAPPTTRAPVTSAAPTSTGPTSAAPTTGGGQAGTCTATYRVIGSWGTGFQAEVTVANNGSTTLNGWTVTLGLASGQSISSLWSGVNSGTSGTVAVKNAAYNGTLTGGASTTFGFTANGSSASTPSVTCASP